MQPHPAIDHVLVGVDAHGLAVHATLMGFSLARRLGADVRLVHAVDVPPPMWHGLDRRELEALHAASIQRQREEAVRWASLALRDSAFAEEDLEELLETRLGKPARAILEAAHDVRAGLILLGPHEKTSLMDFGSTARAVLARAEVPVWVQGRPVAAIERILVPFDFSEHAEHALCVAQAVAQALGSTITVLTCYVPPTYTYSNVEDAVTAPRSLVEQDRARVRQALDERMAAITWGELDHEYELVEGDPTEQIVERAAGQDLIVLGTHGRSALSRFILGSVTYSVLKLAEQPVVAVPHPGADAWRGCEEGARPEAARA